ncbi:MAG: hypothetical protein IT434_13205 [Phycisphaerales bacterium]|jgi:hypothetical protein|nr:hypothetical protein [Phycisphaerales bacterium]
MPDPRNELRESGGERSGNPAWLRESWPTLLSRRATLWWYRRGDRYARHRSILAQGLDFARPTTVPPLREAIALQLALRLPRSLGRAAPEWLVLALASVLSGVIHVLAALLGAIVWLVRVPVRMVLRVVRRIARARDAGRVRRECFVDVAPGVAIGIELGPPGATSGHATTPSVRLESYQQRGTRVLIFLRRVGEIAPGATWWVFLHARPESSPGEHALASLPLPFHHVPGLELRHWPSGRVYRAEFDARELGEGAFRLEAGVYDPTTHASMVTPRGAPGIELGVISIESATPGGGA